MLLDGKGAPEIAAACALLSEPLSLAPGHLSTSCDLLPLIDAFDRQPFHVRQIARELQRAAVEAAGGATATRATEEELRHALWVGYADRLGKRREGDPNRVVLATGHGAALTRESGVRHNSLKSSGRWVFNGDLYSAGGEQAPSCTRDCCDRSVGSVLRAILSIVS